MLLYLIQKLQKQQLLDTPHEIKGNGLYCYVSLNAGEISSEELVGDLKNTIRKKIGPIATPDFIHITSGLPKTRSGKIIGEYLEKLHQMNLKI